MATALASAMRTQGNTVTVSKTLDNGMEVVYTATSTPGNSMAALKALMDDLENDLAELLSKNDDSTTE